MTCGSINEITSCIAHIIDHIDNMCGIVISEDIVKKAYEMNGCDYVNFDPTELKYFIKYASDCIFNKFPNMLIGKHVTGKYGYTGTIIKIYRSPYSYFILCNIKYDDKQINTFSYNVELSEAKLTDKVKKLPYHIGDRVIVGKDRYGTIKELRIGYDDFMYYVRYDSGYAKVFTKDQIKLTDVQFDDASKPKFKVGEKVSYIRNSVVYEATIKTQWKHPTRKLYILIDEDNKIHKVTENNLVSIDKGVF